jgi:hypothetical protein
MGWEFHLRPEGWTKGAKTWEREGKKFNRRGYLKDFGPGE